MPGGAPHKLRPEDIERTRELLGDGATVKDLAAALGVHRTTVYEWRGRGEELVEDTPDDADLNEYEELCRDFYKAYREGRSKFRQKLMKTVETQSADDWRAAKFILERQFPEEWGDHKSMEVESEEGVSLTIDLSAADQEEENA